MSDLLSAKQQEAEAALNLVLNVTLDASVISPQGPEAAPPPLKDALINISPGQEFEVISKLHNGSKDWFNIENAGLDRPQGWVRRAHAEQTTIGPGEDYYANFFIQIPAGAPYTKPYWHRDDPETDSVNQIADEMYLTLPLPTNAPLVTINYDFAGARRFLSLLPGSINGYSVEKHSFKRGSGRITSKVEVPFSDASGATEKVALAVTPPFSVALEPGEQVLPVADGKETTVKVGVSSNLTGAPAGVLHLDLPSGWRAEPDSLKVSLPKRGDQQDFAFKVFPANLKEGRSEIHAVLDAGGTKYTEGYTLVTREDLGSAYYFQPAVQHVSIVEVKIPNSKDLKLGYILGAGDDIPAVLQQIGMNVTIIPADKIATENLSQYGTIVLGVRAYDAQKDVGANSQKFLDYVSNGGTLVVQHNNDTGAFNSAHFTPYPATLSRERVSVEEAPVTILAPENSIFHYPNEISQKDFDGWVQERGLYFMDKWDDHFTPLLSCHDPNEPDQKGGLLYAKYGKGIYLYSGYAFYRQLPAGVSGAIRLFVNIVSAGSPAASH